MLRVGFLAVGLLVLSGCNGRASTVVNDRPGLVSWSYTDQRGKLVDEYTKDSEQVYKIVGAERVPLFLTDGTTPLTWGQFRAAKGTAKVSCNAGSTTVELQMENLIPNATYTNWVPVYEPPGFREVNIDAQVAFSALGERDGSNNYLVADAEGRGSLTVTVHPGPARFIMPDRDAPELPPCLLDLYQFSINTLYKLDNAPHGETFGDYEKNAWQLVWVFTQGSTEAL